MFARIFLHLTASISVLGILLITVLRGFWIHLPDISDPGVFLPIQSTRITDRHGNELYRIIGEHDRTVIEENDIPTHLKNAFIAVEDRRFYDRSCIDVRALIRASIANIGNFGSQGGSTITQQLVRTVLLSPEKSIDRKIREIMLACQLERKMSKDEILALYVNWIAFGHGISGIEQASQYYFGISARDTSLEQAAVLAALPQRPSYFSPYGENRYISLDKGLKSNIRSRDLLSKNAINDSQITSGLLGRKTRIQKESVIIPGRTNDVLRKMEEQKFISSDERKFAEEQLVSLPFKEPGHPIIAPHFVFWIQEELEDPLPKTIETTLDIRFQNIVEEAVVKNYNNALTYGAENIAVIVLDRRTQEIIAYKGNTGFFSGEEGWIDMVQAPRQPGSSFKPFVYATAFTKGYSPESKVIDSPLTIGAYKPKNYEGGYLWRMTMAHALSKSRNIPALKTYFRIGEEDPILRLAASLGASTPFAVKNALAKKDIDIEFGWPLALGAAETPLIEMVHAYSTLANNGVYRPLKYLMGDVDTFSYQAVDPQVAQDITEALSNESARPKGYWRDMMALPQTRAAIKTGTSNIGRAARDTWTIGYTNDFVVGVWAGNADGSPLLKDASGLTIALPIWREVMLNL